MRRTVCWLFVAACWVPGIASGADAAPASIAAAFKKAEPAVVTLKATYTRKVGGAERRAVQSHLGVIVSPDGLVMFTGAAAGLVEGVSNVVATVGGEEVPAAYVGHAQGVAFARLEPEQPTVFPFLHFDAAREAAVGERVFAIGVLGSAYNHARIMVASHVAAVLERPARMYVFGRKDVQQGAPVLKADGAAIGIIAVDGEFYKLAMRHPDRKKALAALLAHPTVLPAQRLAPLIQSPPGHTGREYAKRGWIGAAIDPVSGDILAELGINRRRGVYVSYVVPGSTVTEAGLRAGDVIVSWAGETVAGQTAAEILEFRRAVQSTKPGTEVAFEIVREGKKIGLKAKVENTPPGFAQAKGTRIRALGLTVKPLTYDVRLSYRLQWESPGVIVSWVEPGGRAGLAGLRRLDIIKKVDGAAVENPKTLAAAVREARKDKEREEIVLLVGRDRNTKTALIKVPLGK
jgi:serine protease Do